MSLLIHGFGCSSEVCFYLSRDVISYFEFYFKLFCPGNPGSGFCFGEGNAVRRSGTSISL